MTRIVRTHYRYKRPPKRKQQVAIEVPEVVTVRDRKQRRASDRPQAPDDTKPTPPPPANDDRKPSKPSAIVTIRRKSRFGRAEDITAEEANRRANLADGMMQDFKRQIVEKLKDRS